MSLKACKDQVKLFEDLFPQGTEVTPESLALAHKKGLDVEWFAEQNLPADALEALAKDSKDAFVRSALARNPYTPVSILSDLAKDDKAVVRQGVAQNSNTLIDTLDVLAMDVIDYVRQAVAGNQNIPKNVLITLTKDEFRTDGLLVNAWRSIQLSPDETAEAASWPVAEADLHARHLALVKWKEEHQLDHLMGDPRWHDPIMAGWWLWGQSCWIGSGFCSGKGPWTADENNRLVKCEKGKVRKKRPDTSSGGHGINSPFLREAGISKQIPHLHSNGSGVNHADLRDPNTAFHSLTMPKLQEWFKALSARLRHVRILNGDYTRALTNSALVTLSVQTKNGHVGIFLDPPYSGSIRESNLYTEDSASVSSDVRKWCLENGDNRQYHIVLAGYDTEHTELESHGWVAIEWFKTGFLRGGMGNISGKSQQDRERLWLSPHCLKQNKQDLIQTKLF